MRRLNLYFVLVSLLVTLSAAACGEDDAVESDEEARRAYLGLDGSIDKSLNLGMAGFNAATSANIEAQTTDGDVTGTVTVGGQVDQGTSSNKEMRLVVTMVEYSDGPAIVVDDEEIIITYDTDPEAVEGELPALDLSLRNIPDGTFTGTMGGTFYTTGDLEGSVTLDLVMDGDIEDDGTGGIQRVLGTTHVIGTATSGDGVYDVDVTL